MAYPSPFLSLRWLFTLRNAPDEVAETGLHVQASGNTQADVETLLAGFDAGASGLYLAMNSLLGSAPIQWATYSSLAGVRAAGVGVDGKEFTDPVERSFGPQFGTSGQVHPQLSVALSLRSGSRLGRANYGRMFLPHTMLALNSQSPLSPVPTDAATAGGSFIQAVNSWADDVLPLSHVVNVSKVGGGSMKAVRQVQVGSVTDTQRRRREQLQEQYATADVVLP